MERKNVDVAVIGGGPAGLAASLSSKEYGAKKVVVIERMEELGGILQQCVHSGFGLKYFREELTGPEYAERFIRKVEESDIEVLLNTMVIRIENVDDFKKKVVVVNRKGVLNIFAGSVVLAMGCRERTRGAIRIPGTRPAGIYTAGVAQRLVNIEGYLPGKEVVILGSGDIGLIMARRMKLEGADVKGVFEILPYPGGIYRNIVQCLQDYNIGLFLSHTVVEIKGKERVESVVVSKVDKNFLPYGKKKEIKCDTLLLSVGLIPENELSLRCGIMIDENTLGPVVDERRQTNISGIFACGNVLQVHDIVDNVTEEGIIAGKYASLYSQKKLKEVKWKNVKYSEKIRFVTPQKISATEEVSFFMRVKNVYEKKIRIRIKDTDIFQSFPYARPAEMIEFKLKKEHLEKIKDFEEIFFELEEFGEK